MLPIALSPCPNDTFLFHAWIHALVGRELLPQPAYGDIEQLNQWALERKYPLIKISIACFDQIADDYQLLPIGAALGEQAGPKIIAKEPFNLEEMVTKRIAIPGKETTAHLLFNTFAPPAKEKLFCRYNEIGDLINQGKVDCGVIIHESRFTYEKHGFHQIADLGTLWDHRFGLPLPLGGLAVRRDLPETTKMTIVAALQESLRYAKAHPEVSREFVSSLAQEKDPGTIAKHIALYVNRETEQLSSTGILAIKTLLQCAGKFANVQKVKPWVYTYETSDFCNIKRS